MYSGHTLRDIAAAAGVSVSTVSRVLRHRPEASAAAVHKVELALRTLGVVSPRSTEGRAVVAIVQNAPAGSDVDPFEALYLELRSRIFARGQVALRVFAAEGLPSPVPHLAEVPLAGALVLGGGPAGFVAADLHEAGIGYLRISNAGHPDEARIVLDDRVGIDTAVRHLAHLGHRRMGLAVPDDSAEPARTAAFRKALAETLHITATRDQAPVATAGPGVLAGAQAARELLDRDCTAVISCSPALTFGLLEATRRAGLSVPHDLSLLTVGDMPDAEVMDPPLTQVTFDWAELAEAALAELAGLASGGARRPDYSVTPDLVLRSSAKPLAQR